MRRIHERQRLLRTELSQWLLRLYLVKYSNGGCSGFEPDSLFIYSVYNFSNRIF